MRNKKVKWEWQSIENKKMRRMQKTHKRREGNVRVKVQKKTYQLGGV